MAETAALKWSLAVMILIITALSVNCVSGGQHTPDETIQISVDKDIILTGGDSAWVTAQLYYKGEPLRASGVNVTFLCNDSSKATLTRNNYNVTDDSGLTRILLTAGDNPGPVKITAFYNGSNGTISNASYVNVSMWGNIGGIILDEKGVNIPNAHVSLWKCHYDSATRQWVKDDILPILENPQLTNDGRTGYTGQFAFFRVPVGTYVLMADREGHNNTTVVALEQGTTTGIVYLPGDILLAFNSSTMGIPSPTHNGSEIWGIVCDYDRMGVLNANVSLWYCEYNKTSGQWEKTIMVDISENPVKSSNSNVRPGEYRFEKLLPGTYYVLANDTEYGFSYYAIVHLETEQATAYVVLPAPMCRFPMPPTPTPSPSASR